MTKEEFENNKDLVVDAENVSLEFKVPKFKYDTLKDRVINLIKGKTNQTRRFRVLDGISFSIKKGESLGVLGHNGAGKSTLLKIVAGILPPKEGTIQTRGQVILLNLGSGFDMEANAIENIYLNGAICGFTRKQIDERFDSIVKFAELEEFLTLPLKNYSSGMVSRLGFAIAIDVHPDLLLIDEVLSVGDVNFQNKCKAKIKELQEDGTSLMFVSHSAGSIQEFCQKAIWIEDSKVMAYGDSKDICAQYLAYNQSKQNVPKEPVKIAAVITTFKREDFVTKNVAKLKECKDFISHVYVIDNGQTIDESLGDDFVTIIRNKNVGGSGGFARGMMLAKKDGYSHVLLMDDDIQFEKSTYLKAYKTIVDFDNEHKKDWVGFAMRLLDQPNIQFEMGSKWNGVKMMINNHNLDMNKPNSKAKNEVHQKYNYSAWWSLIMPLSVIDDYDYPFPFFFKFDDIEYGLRRKREEIVFSNDFIVLHQSFDQKVSPITEYYLSRNSIITNVYHIKFPLLKSIIRFNWKEIKHMFKGDYKSMYFINKGVEDFLEGPNQFIDKQIDEYHNELMATEFTYKNSFSGIIKNFFHHYTLIFKLMKKWKETKCMYIDKYSYLTSEEYWKKVLGVNE